MSKLVISSYEEFAQHVGLVALGSANKGIHVDRFTHAKISFSLSMKRILCFLHVILPVQDHTATNAVAVILHLLKEKTERHRVIIKADLARAGPAEVIP